MKNSLSARIGLLLLLSFSVNPSAEAASGRGEIPCAADLRRFCPDTSAAGGSAALECLQTHLEALSVKCSRYTRRRIARKRREDAGLPPELC